jgi:hypothetical protein
MKNPEIVPEPDRHLRRDNRHQHDNDQGHSREARYQAQDDERTAGNLDDPDKWPHEFGIWDANVGKAPRTQQIRENKLLDSFREEDDKAHQ